MDEATNEIRRVAERRLREDAGGSHTAGWPPCPYCGHHWGSTLEITFVVLRSAMAGETVVVCPTCGQSGVLMRLQVIEFRLLDIEGAKHWPAGYERG